MKDSEKRRKLEKWDVSPGGGHYHSRAEGGVLPGPKRLSAARGAAPGHSLTPERVLGAGRPLLAAVQRLWAVPWVVQPEPRPRLAGCWVGAGVGRRKVKGERGWSPGAGWGPRPSAHPGFLPAECGALSPGQRTSQVPRSGTPWSRPDPRRGSRVWAGLFSSSWEGATAGCCGAVSGGSPAERKERPSGARRRAGRGG